MNMLNSVILEGVLDNDPVSVVNKNDNGLLEVDFQIAVKRYYKGQTDARVEEVSYFDVLTYGTMAETLVNTFKIKRGAGVRVVGRIKQNWYKDANGIDCSKVVVIAEHVEVKPNATNEHGGN